MLLFVMFCSVNILYFVSVIILEGKNFGIMFEQKMTYKTFLNYRLQNEENEKRKKYLTVFKWYYNNILFLILFFVLITIVFSFVNF